MAQRRLFAILAAGILLGAYLLRFLQDDAFIAFHYARNLVEGKGLTWFGERVEGYTDFLWVLWNALGLRLGFRAEDWSQAGGLLSLAVALAALWRIAGRLEGGPLLRPAALFLFGSQFSVLAYATGGLETMAQTAALALCAVLVLEIRKDGGEEEDRCDRRRSISLALLGAAAVLLHPDSLLLVLLFFLQVRTSLSGRAKLLCAGIFLGVLGTWLVWKSAYYGVLLPNTYYAKVGGPLGPRIQSGLRYLGRYASDYLFPFLLPAVLFVRPRGKAKEPVLRLLFSWVLVWIGYLCWSGGDFMEYRFFIPVTPFLAVLTARILLVEVGARLAGRPGLVLSLGCLLFSAASLAHALRFRGTTEDLALDSIPQLASFYGLAGDGDFGRIGRLLARDFEGLDPLLALQPVGAIPYASRLRTVDMWGLNDPFVARRGNPVPADFLRPGHRRHAPLAYLRKRGVHFILGHPLEVPSGFLSRPRTADLAGGIARNLCRYEPRMPENAVFVELPLDRGRSLIAWYLTPDPGIDRRIREGDWLRRSFRIRDPEKPKAQGR